MRQLHFPQNYPASRTTAKTCRAYSDILQGCNDKDSLHIIFVRKLSTKGEKVEMRAKDSHKTETKRVESTYLLYSILYWNRKSGHLVVHNNRKKIAAIPNYPILHIQSPYVQFCTPACTIHLVFPGSWNVCICNFRWIVSVVYYYLGRFNFFCWLLDDIYLYM